VVLDEPNSNLDADGEAALARAMQTVRDRKGIAIVIAHRANALSACDMVMMVSDGVARLLGRRDEVMQKIRVYPGHSDLAALRPSAAPPSDIQTTAVLEVFPPVKEGLR
jgi:ATP-binding cassette subfamily C protein